MKLIKAISYSTERIIYSPLIFWQFLSLYQHRWVRVSLVGTRNRTCISQALEMGESIQVLRQGQGSQAISIPFVPTHSFSCNTVLPANLYQDEKVPDALKILSVPSPLPPNSVFPSVLPFIAFPSPLCSHLPLTRHY